MGSCYFESSHVSDTWRGFPLVTHLYHATDHIPSHTKVLKAQKSKDGDGHMAPVTCVYTFQLVL